MVVLPAKFSPSLVVRPSGFFTGSLLPVASRISCTKNFICTLSRDYSSKSHSARRSEEHTSELQSPCNLVCRLLLEKKKKKKKKVRIKIDSVVMIKAIYR